MTEEQAREALAAMDVFQERHQSMIEDFARVRHEIQQLTIDFEKVYGEVWQDYLRLAGRCSRARQALNEIERHEIGI